MNPRTWTAMVLLALTAGCAKDSATLGTPMMATADYAARDTLETSLFKSDQAVLDEAAVARILGSKIELPRQARIALLYLPGRGYTPWRQDEFFKTERLLSSVKSDLEHSDRVAEAVPLPGLMTPREPTLPSLREAAVRLQADLLLVFRTSTDLQTRQEMFSREQIKASSACELVLLDVRTGVVPYTRVMVREAVEKRQGTDFNEWEARTRTARQAAEAALAAAVTDLKTFLARLP